MPKARKTIFDVDPESGDLDEALEVLGIRITDKDLRASISIVLRIEYSGDVDGEQLYQTCLGLREWLGKNSYNFISVSDKSTEGETGEQRKPMRLPGSLSVHLDEATEILNLLILVQKWLQSQEQGGRVFASRYRTVIRRNPRVVEEVLAVFEIEITRQAPIKELAEIYRTLKPKEKQSKDEPEA